jgi:hypothetical protein
MPLSSKDSVTHLIVALFACLFVCLSSAHADTFISRYNYLVMAIILSSFGKVFVFLMMIWDYDIVTFTTLISLFVLTSNVLAVRGKCLVVNKHQLSVCLRHDHS